jgi:hypothetical protein
MYPNLSNLVIYKYTTTPVPAVNPAPDGRFPNGAHGRSRFGHRDPGRDLERVAEHSSAIGLVLVLSVDWFIGMARALGNCVATVVVAAWEGDLDRVKARQVLDGTKLVDVTAG